MCLLQLFWVLFVILVVVFLGGGVGGGYIWQLVIKALCGVEPFFAEHYLAGVDIAPTCSGACSVTL